MKKFAYTVLTAAMAGGIALGTDGAASAGHCVAPANEESSPGFSYFGTDHVQEANHAEGSKEGPHVAPDGTRSSGASGCRDATGSPSERAPGKR
ncbi:MAG: hypothetical protein KY451_08095 [Actinobacteria bacterium]|nr:hypothetical protein [Actinomycetota bacterium]